MAKWIPVVVLDSRDAFDRFWDAFIHSMAVEVGMAIAESRSGVEELSSVEVERMVEEYFEDAAQLVFEKIVKKEMGGEMLFVGPFGKFFKEGYEFLDYVSVEEVKGLVKRYLEVEYGIRLTRRRLRGIV